jgi:hypothetical protein
VGRTTRPAVLLDVSLTGCLLQCDALLDHGAILDLHLRLEPDPFVAKARVVDSWLDGSLSGEGAPAYLAGLEWLGLPVREQTALRRFIAAEQQRRSAGAR